MKFDGVWSICLLLFFSIFGSLCFWSEKWLTKRDHDSAWLLSCRSLILLCSRWVPGARHWSRRMTKNWVTPSHSQFPKRLTSDPGEDLCLRRMGSAWLCVRETLSFLPCSSFSQCWCPVVLGVYIAWCGLGEHRPHAKPLRPLAPVSPKLLPPPFCSHCAVAHMAWHVTVMCQEWHTVAVLPRITWY